MITLGLRDVYEHTFLRRPSHEFRDETLFLKFNSCTPYCDNLKVYIYVTNDNYIKIHTGK